MGRPGPLSGGRCRQRDGHLLRPGQLAQRGVRLLVGRCLRVRAAPTATTTKPWASRPAAPGWRCAATFISSGSTYRRIPSGSSESATCPVTSLATACCQLEVHPAGGRLRSPPRVPGPRSRPHRFVRGAGAPGRPAPIELGRLPARADLRRVVACGPGTPRRCRSVRLRSEPLESRRQPLSPPALISAILAAPVDLLWFGGIGTFVKAPDEPDSSVGDHANDAVRITADQVRARVVAEGGNLGITQRGRIRYSRRGGRINTDFIDNAAGVATSDREVNCKILLALAIERGRLGLERARRLPGPIGRRGRRRGPASGGPQRRRPEPGRARQRPGTRRLRGPDRRPGGGRAGWTGPSRSCPAPRSCGSGERPAPASSGRSWRCCWPTPSRIWWPPSKRRT